MVEGKRGEHAGLGRTPLICCKRERAGSRVPKRRTEMLGMTA
jgi:hypothetical protein